MHTDILNIINKDELTELIETYTTGEYKKDLPSFFIAVTKLFKSSPLLKQTGTSSITDAVIRLNNTKTKVFTLKKYYLEDLMDTIYSEKRHDFSTYLVIFTDNQNKSVYVNIPNDINVINSLSKEVTTLYKTIGIKSTLEALICCHM